MIRSTHIPIILNRICDDTRIRSALLVTADGELLGASATVALTSPLPQLPPPESLGTLLTDIAWDYQRLGEEYATLHPDTTSTTTASSSSSSSTMECIFLEMEYGTVGISSCHSSSSSSSSGNQPPTIGCFVMVIATPETPLGWIRLRLQTVTQHVQESLFQLSSSPAVVSNPTNNTTTPTNANTTIHNDNTNHSLAVT